MLKDQIISYLRKHGGVADITEVYRAVFTDSTLENSMQFEVMLRHLDSKKLIKIRYQDWLVELMEKPIYSNYKGNL